MCIFRLLDFEVLIVFYNSTHVLYSETFLIYGQMIDYVDKSNFCNMPGRAQELARLIGGTALTMAELENYHPEDGMILANATSVGMYPNVNETPLSKV